MDTEFISLLRTWVEEALPILEEQGWTITLEESGNGEEIAIDMEIPTQHGRITLQDIGYMELSVLDKATLWLRRGECNVYTDGQLEDAVRQFMDWFHYAEQPQERFECPDGKLVYESRRLATAALKRVTSRPGMTSALTTYECPACQHWHVGGMDGRVGVKRRSFPSY